MARTIVLGYDGSPGAHHALAKAVELAKLEGARIAVVFAYEIPAAYGGETGDYRRAVRELAEQTAAAAVPLLEEARVEYAIELVPERPVQGLVDVAEKTGASMIVIGTNGEHPIKGVVLGSVPQKLLYVSPVPVLVVPGPVEEG
ncbi:MAG: universal stress protein [Gaiellaceae bacterium]